MTLREVVIACAAAVIGFIAGRLSRSGETSKRSRVTYASLPASGPASTDGRWQVIMSDAGPRKIEVIRIVRQVTGLGLKESKDLIEARPPVTLASGLREEAARRMAEDLERVGAKAATVV